MRLSLSALCGLLMLLAATTTLGQPATSAQWIWYPEDPASQANGQTRYFRLAVDLPSAPTRARVRFLSDDAGQLFVNGEPAPAAVEQGRGGQVFDLTASLRAGRNVVAASVHNSGGPAGLIINGRVDCAGGQTVRLFTNASWRVAKTVAGAADDWAGLEFDDSGWLAAKVIGGVLAAPWYGLPVLDMNAFLDPDEVAAMQAWRASRVAVPASLAAEPLPTATLRQEAGGPLLRINGRTYPPMLYRGFIDPLTDLGRRQIAIFRDAGVHLFSYYYPMPSSQPGPGQYDFSRLDDAIRAYLSVDPDAYVHLVLHVIAPTWWLDAHPDELVRYAGGDDYNSGDECERVRAASLASEAWYQNTVDIWRRTIEHLQAQPWGRRVIGYQPGAGIYTEWHYYGSWSNQMPDTGPAMTRHFRGWLQRKYRTDAALQAAWRDPRVTLATATVPLAAPRVAQAALGLRDPAAQAWAADYYRCQQEITAERIDSLCRLTKQLTAGRAITGAFYGYWQGVLQQTQGGHLELPRLLRSEAIDYFVAPYDYDHRLMGDDGRPRPVIDTFAAAGKMHLIEDDTRTYLHTVDEFGRAPDQASSIAETRRIFGTALIHRSGLWYCDFGSTGGGGWYDEPALIGDVAKLVKLAERRLTQPSRSVAQVALVADPRSCYAVSDGDAMSLHLRSVEQVTGALHRTGTPFDFLNVDQLATADLSRYRVLVFLNTVAPDAAGRATLRRAAQGRAVVWLWAPGINDGRRFGPDAVRELTGFATKIDGPGVMAHEATAAEGAPLTAGLTRRASVTLDPASRQPVAAAGDQAAWFNPRDAQTMATYAAYDYTAVPGGLDWHVATRDGWSDVHLKADLPNRAGLGLTVSGTDGLASANLRLVVKDADGAEFMTDLHALTTAPTPWQLPLASLRRADWYHGPSETIRLPLTGLKLVAYGVQAERPGWLHVRDLATFAAKDSPTPQRIWDGPGCDQPCLTLVEQAGTTVIARSEQGAPLVACQGPAGRRQVFSALAALPTPALCALLDESGVHRYVTQPGVLVQADSRLLMLHTKAGGPCTVHLPQPERLLDALSGEPMGQGRDITINLPAPSTLLLERLP